MKITPFLESANKGLDYGPVSVAPEVRPYLYYARPENESSTAVIRRDVYLPTGKLSFFSQQALAGPEYMNGDRAISRIDGICVADDTDNKFVFHPHYLEEARKINEGYFQRFWAAGKSATKVVSVTEEIAFRPELPEQASDVVVRTAHYYSPKKNQPRADAAADRPAAETKLAGDDIGNGGEDTPGAPERDASEGVEAQARQDGVGKEPDRSRFPFSKVASVGVGVAGIGAIADGVLRSFKHREHDEDEKPRSRWKRLAGLGEIALGAAGVTWAAYVMLRRDPKEPAR